MAAELPDHFPADSPDGLQYAYGARLDPRARFSADGFRQVPQSLVAVDYPSSFGDHEHALGALHIDTASWTDNLTRAEVDSDYS